MNTTVVSRLKARRFELRAKRIAPLLKMIESVFNEHGYVNLVDIGGSKKYWNIIPMEYILEHNMSITIVNRPNIIKPEESEIFKFIEADACDLSIFPDRYFHIAHSNSVVEHVGDWKRMVQFAKEILRISQKYFVQTPNFWFPIEPHCMTLFFHWLPKSARVWLVLHFQLGHWKKATSVDEAVRTVDSARMLSQKMFKELFKDAQVLTERYWGLPKSFIALKQ